MALTIGIATASASDGRAAEHLDTPEVVADPRTDIGDLYAWMSPDKRRLNLVITLVGRSFADDVVYAFHVGSSRSPGFSASTASITCATLLSQPQCQLVAPSGTSRVNGDMAETGGQFSADGALRVFAGPRDDPFFNNVRGTREAYTIARTALADAPRDVADCPAFNQQTSGEILARWRQTEGGPAKNFLAGWTATALVVSVDAQLLQQGGPMLGVWAETRRGTARIDRMGRPLTANMLLAPLDGPEAANRLKQKYNESSPASDAFVSDIERALGFYDGFDGVCGNAFLAQPAGASRYLELALLLADDRLWINADSGLCDTPFAVELAWRGGRPEAAGACGGRTPQQDSVDTYRSLLVTGAASSVSDGVDADDQPVSEAFPFLAPPVPSTSVSGR